jgi:hypothetical protein
MRSPTAAADSPSAKKSALAVHFCKFGQRTSQNIPYFLEIIAFMPASTAKMRQFSRNCRS